MLAKKSLTYPVWLFLLLLFAKVIYIVVESNYNYDILTVATSSDFSRTILEDLNDRGHLIASVGFTLFIIPLLYYLATHSSIRFSSVFLGIYGLIASVSFYLLLNLIVQIVVDNNQDKRYEAYYTNLVKYGMLNNIIHYDSFVEAGHLKSIDVNDRILITHIFLLLYIDDALIEKFRQKGESNVVDLVLEKYNKEEYQKKYEQFKKIAKEIELLWIEFNKQRDTLSKSLKSLNDNTSIQEAYSHMKDGLKKQYLEYQNIYTSLEEKIQKKLSLKYLAETKRSLERYFKYKGYKKAQQQYHEKMIQKFGHMIEPKKWLDNKGKVTYQSIEMLIREEAKKEVQSKMLGLELGLSAKDFFEDIRIKSKLAKKLKEKGILIPEDFDYSYNDFFHYYRLMTAKKSKSIIESFYKVLNKKIGDNDLKLDMKWEEYIYSHYLREKLQSLGIENVDLYQKILESKELGNFDKILYLPRAYEIARKRLIHEKEDFYSDTEIAKMGDEAIKLLYIPPLALWLSMLALLLNLITVLGMFLSIAKVPRSIRYMMVVFSLLIIILTPLLSEDFTHNKILNRVENNYFIRLFQWSGYWVNLNYRLHEEKF